jgi:hypothetical protein
MGSVLGDYVVRLNTFCQLHSEVYVKGNVRLMNALIEVRKGSAVVHFNELPKQQTERTDLARRGLEG